VRKAGKERRGKDRFLGVGATRLPKLPKSKIRYPPLVDALPDNALYMVVFRRLEGVLSELFRGNRGLKWHF
jgi:hypothetical protein